MIVVGGTYNEVCFEPTWQEIYGSGFRAVQLILELDKTSTIKYYTYLDNKVAVYLEAAGKIYNNLEVQYNLIEKNYTFYYDHPLREPMLYPWISKFTDIVKQFEIDTMEDILVYGMLESQPLIHGNRVIYDPQSPSNPVLFSKNTSSAKQLIYITNFQEASKLSCSSSIEDITSFFFTKEKVYALILKMGPKGAILFWDGGIESCVIPCYQTENVWTIGSGDVFTSVFAYNWFNEKALVDSASLASKATAIYSEFKNLRIKDYKAINFKEVYSSTTPIDRIYLAGPFFTFSQRWLINEVYSSLIQMGLNVFSPYHDVGYGIASEVVDKDIDAIKSSKIVLAIVDGLDSGTLFEIGYARSRNIKVICFVQNESKESLLMLEGTNCKIVNDLSSAVYQTYWNLITKND